MADVLPATRRVLVLLAAVAALLVACGSSRAETIRVVSDRYVGAKVVRIGPFEVRRDPTLRGARNAFGRPTSCRLKHRSDATVVWEDLGVTMHVLTHAVLPGKTTACTAPARVFVDVVTVKTERWQTQRGLKIGDSLERLRKLYPRAFFRDGSWWLSVARGYIGTKVPSKYPALAAGVVSGRVRSLTTVIGAQGE